VPDLLPGFHPWVVRNYSRHLDAQYRWLRRPRRPEADTQVADIAVAIVAVLDEQGRGIALAATDYLTRLIDRE